MEWKIDKEQAGVRIDKFLNEQLTDLSRSRIQQLIEEDCILVNNDSTKANYRLRDQDEISCEIPEVKDLEAVPQDIPLNIVYEDADVIVVNKPKGMVVHPAAGNHDGTLVNALLFHCQDLSGINGVIRPGIVHRIDKDTTGLLVAAKNDKAHEALSKQLQDKTASRKYLALCHGVMPHEYGTIDAPIGRDSKDRQKMTVTSKNSRDAITHFKVRERFANHTLIECSLETGRTHQIRVHMQYIQFPIVGDPKYSYKNTPDTQGQMLHAFELSFVHPSTQELMVFEAPLPEAYVAFIEELKRREN